VFALDFDGVVVDSEPEVSEYGLVAAQRRWPEALSGVQEPGARAALLAALRDCRPRLVKGYEAMVMARLLAEDGARVAAVLRDWPALLAASLESWGCDAEELSAEFQALRAEAMAAHKKEWLRGSKPYKGMVDALRHCPSPVYFASSKAGGLVSLLLRENLGLDIPEESPRLYGGLLPPNEAKVAALRDIASRPVCQTPGAKLHFIDDRFETLQARGRRSWPARRWPKGPPTLMRILLSSALACEYGHSCCLQAMTAPGEHAVEGWNLYLAGWCVPKRAA